MTGKLILRHEIFRCLPKLLAVGSVTTMLVIQIMMFKIARSEGQWEPLGGGLFLLQAVILASCAAVFFVPSAGNRSRAWEQGLPLPAPQLWRAYLTALAVGSLLLLGGVGAILSLVQILMARMTEGELLVFSSLGELLARPASLLILGAACIAAWQPQLARLHDHPSWSRYRWILGAGLLGLLYGLARLPMVYSLVPVVVAVLLAVRAGRRVPMVLTSSLDRGTPAASTADLAAGLADVGPSRRVRNYLILRQLFKWPASLPLILPITLLFGVLMSGHNFLSESNTDLRLFNYFMVVYILFSMTGHLVEKLHLVDHLPISRRSILLWLLTLALFFRLCKPGMTIKKVRVRFWIIMAALLGLHMLMFTGFISEFSSEWIVSGSFLSTMRSLVSTGLTGGFAMGFVMVMMIFGAWRLAETAFVRVEAPRS